MSALHCRPARAARVVRKRPHPLEASDAAVAATSVLISLLVKSQVDHASEGETKRVTITGMSA